MVCEAASQYVLLILGAIAEELFLSTHTIDTHRENIKRKLGLRTLQS